MLNIMLRVLGADSTTRNGIGSRNDCDLNADCWCPSAFEIDSDGSVEILGWNDITKNRSTATKSASILIVFRYFIVRSPETALNVKTGGPYDRPCVFAEGSNSILDTITAWRNTKHQALNNPNIIIFNAGNWESNEKWNKEAFGRDVRKRADALIQESGFTHHKVIFLGPPAFNDAILQDCPDKRGLKSSAKVDTFTESAIRALQGSGVRVVNVGEITRKGAPDQLEFWNKLRWAGGRFELCANHQTPSMYGLFWSLITEQVGGRLGGDQSSDL